MPPVPQTTVRTSHALTIKANGITVGLINGWNPTQSRTVTPIFEVDIDTSGAPVEYMPGNVTGLTITVQRYDTYISRMEQAFGTPDLFMLSRQSQPFSVLEAWSNPDPTQQKERFMYAGCWFTSLGRTLRSDGDRLVNVNATLVYTSKLPMSGFAVDALSALGTI